jgi:hypothetical protein
MHPIAETPSSAYSHAFGGTLSLEDLRRHTPAVFADSASERTKPSYRFINTHKVLQALFDAGFQVANARQTRTRRGTDPIHARHMIRLRPMREILTLDSCIPEICLVNAHDGSSAYQLLAGLYRPLCKNGLICRMGDFAMIRIPHRANVLADVVAGARELTLQFDRIGGLVHSMAARMLSEAEQLAFATRAPLGRSGKSAATASRETPGGTAGGGCHPESLAYLQCSPAGDHDRGRRLSQRESAIGPHPASRQHQRRREGELRSVAGRR